MKKPCPRYDAEFTRARNLPEIKALEKQYQGLFKYLSLHTGSEVKTIENAEYIHSTLFIEVNLLYLLQGIEENLLFISFPFVISIYLIFYCRP